MFSFVGLCLDVTLAWGIKHPVLALICIVVFLLIVIRVLMMMYGSKRNNQAMY